jgi:hypothetical protein
MALNMVMIVINVSLAGVASRARKLGLDAPGSKGASMVLGMTLSHCGGDATALALRRGGE